VSETLSDIGSAREFEFSEQDFQTIASKVKNVAGINLSASKRSLVYSRLAKRIRKLDLKTFTHYIERLENDGTGKEMDFLITALTTNVTAFFRESHHFEHLYTKVLPGLAARARDGARIRLWSCACSSGEEPYSIALCVQAAIPDAAQMDVKILATDIDESILRRARTGIYPEESLKTIPTDFHRNIQRNKGDNSIRPNDQTRALVSFGQLNLFSPWPFQGDFDVIFCRNVAIYFDKPTQATLWQKLAQRLAENGQLYIGHSERISGPADGLLTSNGITQYARARQEIQ